eukprot:CAMPEP_0177634498 /NCGR_PEP_ID=MMETSP0447-20121125/3399_1 /TAXON_ID=0 /ORGANISM="Stygamoeba regulata, Strain BSH-02190019" /LENGTH=557 /DNA_ID=CAMNT_0019136221 /DNA_START=113 /DNA_END=1787 /DNA_ORIENTATION=-
MASRSPPQKRMRIRVNVIVNDEQLRIPCDGEKTVEWLMREIERRWRVKEQKKLCVLEVRIQEGDIYLCPSDSIEDAIDTSLETLRVVHDTQAAETLSSADGSNDLVCDSSSSNDLRDLRSSSDSSPEQSSMMSSSSSKATTASASSSSSSSSSSTSSSSFSSSSSSSSSSSRTLSGSALPSGKEPEELSDDPFNCQTQLHESAEIGSTEVVTETESAPDTSSSSSSSWDPLRPPSASVDPHSSETELTRLNNLVCELLLRGNGDYSRSQCEEALLLNDADANKALHWLEEEIQRRQLEMRRIEEENERLAMLLLQEEEQYEKQRRDQDELSLTLAQSIQRREDELGGFECQICYDDVSAEHQFVFSRCQHKVCRSCAHQGLLTQINDNEVFPELKCSFCNKPVPDSDLELILEQENYQRFEHLRLMASLVKLGDFKCCLSVGCEDGVFWTDDPEISGRYECRTCRKKFCLRCQDEWHSGVTCVKYQEWRKENGMADNLLEQMIQKGQIKRCPNPKCQTPSQKKEGCNYLVCTQCKQQWCWNCGATHAACSCGANPHK